ncbi:rab3 GTPase-activating protein non-catalytic subunit-like [Watersipora subatra]|uniref:rab3 GTPase-activating protein non-catalytic subunit-like n=1 Tax=Watersipora subatra TaxID=2589382 RepID=UPI00355BC394
MSCQLGILSKVKDVTVLKRYIFPSSTAYDKEDISKLETSGWDNDWGWEDEAQQGAVDKEEDCKEGWLHECEVSVSSLGDLLVVAKDDRLALLQLNYEEGHGEVFTILLKRVLSEFPREMITCVFGLPIISHKRSSEGLPEWTCIVVGFNTGHVRMYSETGTKVLDQMLHNESVVAIKCKTYSPPRYPGSNDLTEELSILYETAIVSIEGFGLFHTLRACKNRAAMAAASGSQELDLPPLNYKKWGLRNQGQAFDHISAGTYIANPFDQLQAASMVGFREQISPVPPTCHVYACAGENPYVGIYHAIDGQSYRLLPNITGIATELISAGAAKLFSWGSNFLRKQEPPKDEKKEKKTKVEAATPVFRRFSVQDKRRLGYSMCLSPCGLVAAVTDSLGRVILLDVARGVIKRMWKGYRNAQVGWMSVKERPSTKPVLRRSAFFLLIYAPKRGLLEVWLADSGSRVGAFNVGKGCRLIYPGCSLLGVNSSTYKLVKGKICQCFLLNADGELLYITIPFHLALSDANSKGAHDRQLMSLAKAVLKEREQEPQAMTTALWESISKLKLTTSLTVIIEKMLATSHITSQTAVDIIDKTIDLVKQRTRQTSSSEKLSEGAETSIDVESRLLLEQCESRKVLIAMHSKLVEYSTQSFDSQVTDISSVQPCGEVASLFQLTIPAFSPKKVAFEADSHLTLSTFLSFCSSQHTALKMHEVRDPTHLVSLGRLLFEPCLEHGVSLNEVIEVTSPLTLTVRFMLNCLLEYYLSLQNPSDSHLPLLEDIISTLRQVDVTQETEEPSDRSPSPVTTCDDLTPALKFDQQAAPFPPQSDAPWWAYIKDTCEASSSLKSYIHIAAACRSICIKATEQLTTELPDSSDDLEGIPGEDKAKDSPWEHLSVDVTMWNVSLSQLEEIIALNNLLRYQRKLPSKEIGSNSQIVTVQQIKTGHRGLIGELVGRWCVANMFCPEEHRVGTTPTGSEESSKPEGSSHMGLYKKAIETFPLSLSSDNINANACWEYMSEWNKGIESLYNFKFALKYLRSIENGCLRHGICYMMWATYLMKRISGLVLLIEKVGKAPKDRLIKKELEMDTATATEFIGVVCDFMEIFLQANCDFGEALLYKEENLWSEHMTGHSLVQMACQQKESNYRLLKHHSLLMNLVSALLVFGMKSVKIMSLFDHNGSKAFFTDLSSHPYLPVEGKDEAVTAYRKDFFCRILRHSVQSLPEWDLLAIPGGLINIDKESDAAKWPVIVMELADSFSLDTDNLRRFYIETLVVYGHDTLALEVLPLMSDPKPAYEAMLDVCCQRFSHYMFEANEETLGEITSSATPLLLNWLNEKQNPSKHEAELVSKTVTMANTNRLLLQIMKGLQASRSYEFAQELYQLTLNLT